MEVAELLLLGGVQGDAEAVGLVANQTHQVEVAAGDERQRGAVDVACLVDALAPPDEPCVHQLADAVDELRADHRHQCARIDQPPQPSQCHGTATDDGDGSVAKLVVEGVEDGHGIRSVIGIRPWDSRRRSARSPSTRTGRACSRGSRGARHGGAKRGFRVSRRAVRESTDRAGSHNVYVEQGTRQRSPGTDTVVFSQLDQHVLVGGRVPGPIKDRRFAACFQGR